MKYKFIIFITLFFFFSFACNTDLDFEDKESESIKSVKEDGDGNDKNKEPKPTTQINKGNEDDVLQKKQNEINPIKKSNDLSIQGSINNNTELNTKESINNNNNNTELNTEESINNNNNTELNTEESINNNNNTELNTEESINNNNNTELNTEESINNNNNNTELNTKGSNNNNNNNTELNTKGSNNNNNNNTELNTKGSNEHHDTTESNLNKSSNIAGNRNITNKNNNTNKPEDSNSYGYFSNIYNFFGHKDIQQQNEELLNTIKKEIDSFSNIEKEKYNFKLQVILALDNESEKKEQYLLILDIITLYKENDKDLKYILSTINKLPSVKQRSIMEKLDKILEEEDPDQYEYQKNRKEKIQEILKDFHNTKLNKKGFNKLLTKINNNQQKDLGLFINWDLLNLDCNAIRDKNSKSILDFEEFKAYSNSYFYKEYKGYCALDEQNKTIYISFPGTSSLTDLTTDAKYSTRKIDGLIGKYHNGFANLMDILYPQIKKIMKTRLGQGYNKIIIGGHSLGAAQSVLCALKLINDREIEINKENISIYALALPPIMDEEAVKSYNKYLGKQTFIVKNTKDIIAQYPPKLHKYGFNIGNELSITTGWGLKHKYDSYLAWFNEANQSGNKKQFDITQHYLRDLDF